ncbi:unnamed protein product [Soboliphyme baturini]|uniref:Uncharacterized protein n=1 Tax=Soboliphyme baturini TaxID=241478 RepID=A0A183IFL7_9BILA|nr:unnamed protein product [Soboliphyme baturini]
MRRQSTHRLLFENVIPSLQLHVPQRKFVEEYKMAFWHEGLSMVSATDVEQTWHSPIITAGIKLDGAELHFLKVAAALGKSRSQKHADGGKCASRDLTSCVIEI